MRTEPRTPRARLLAGTLVLAALCAAAIGLARDEKPAARPLESADWLGLLPDGEAKRRFVLDCTGCHQFDERIARAAGRPRETWSADVARMIAFSGARSGFPVMAHDRDSAATARYLTQHLKRDPKPREPKRVAVVRDAVVEFDLPVPQDLPHDVAVDALGRVVITGMFTHQMYLLDPESGQIDTIPIPVPHANPRAVDIDSTGAWWVALGAPKALARYVPEKDEWRTFRVGHYPHSLALGRPGEVWANGHFTRAPEWIGRIIAATGKLDSFLVTPHPTLASQPGGPIPYEIRVAPDGRVWGSELQGNRIFVCDPERGTFRTWDMPVSHSGPRRFDIDRDGVLWIPAYAANELVRFDPRTEKFERFPLPVPDAVPYVVRIDRDTGSIWLGVAATDAIFEFDPGAKRFTLYPLPSRGVLVRHLAIDPRTHDVWAAYGASPGALPAKVARVRPAPKRGATG